jgi:hypothetical protein
MKAEEEDKLNKLSKLLFGDEDGCKVKDYWDTVNELELSEDVVVLRAVIGILATKVVLETRV